MSSQAQQWWVRTDSEAIGPFSAKELRASAQQSRISPDTAVRLGESGGWVRAGDVKGLFETVADVNENPYRSPSTPAEAATNVRDEFAVHWRVLDITAMVILVVAVLDFSAFVFGIYRLVTGDLGVDVSALVVPPVVCIACVAGALGTFKRKKWGVFLLGAVTLLHSCFVMIFFIGDSFSRCWSSFRTESPDE